MFFVVSILNLQYVAIATCYIVSQLREIKFSHASDMPKSSLKSTYTPSSPLLPFVYTVLSSQTAVRFDLPLVYLSVFM